MRRTVYPYRAIRRTKMFEKNPSSNQENSYFSKRRLLLIVLRAVKYSRDRLWLFSNYSRSDVISSKKETYFSDHSGKIMSCSLSQPQRYVFEVSCCVFERPIIGLVPYIFWLFSINRLCWLIVCHSCEADVFIIIFTIPRILKAYN